MVADLFDTGRGAAVGARLGNLRRVELRRLFVAAIGHVPDDVIGGERTAIVPLHALTQGEDPTLVVGFIDMPLGGKTRSDVGGLLAGPGEIPQNQRIVEIVADEAVALEPLIGSAGRYRNVAGGHADRQCPCRLRAGSTEQRRPKTQSRAEAQRRLPQRSRYRHSAHLILPVTCIRSRRRALRSYGPVAPTV